MYRWRAWDISTVFLLSNLTLVLHRPYIYSNMTIKGFHYLEGKDKKAMSQNAPYNFDPCTLNIYRWMDPLCFLSPPHSAQGVLLINSCPKPTLFTLLTWYTGQILIANKICWFLWSLVIGIITLLIPVCFPWKSQGNRGSYLLKVTYLWSGLPVISGSLAHAWET